MTAQLKKNDLVKVIAPQSSSDRRFFGRYGIVIDIFSNRNTTESAKVVLSNGEPFTFWTIDLENALNESKI